MASCMKAGARPRSNSLTVRNTGFPTSALRVSPPPGLEAIARPCVVAMKALLIGLVDQVERLPWRTVFDAVTRNVEEHVLLHPIDVSHSERRYQNMLPKPPVLRVNDEVADVPADVVDNEV